MVSRKKQSGRSLARKLALSFSAFVLLASLAIVAWMTWWYGRKSLDDFRRLAETNAEFTAELNVPKTPETAESLTKILSCGVGFYFTGGRGAGWPAEFADLISQLSEENRPVAVRKGGHSIAVAPFSKPGEFLVLFREEEGAFPGATGIILAPAVVFTIACAILGVLVGRRIVHPLGTVAAWLPNLDSEPDSDTPPLPDRITRRSDEIGELARALEQTARDLKSEQKLRRESERLATLGRIATSLAHEIKNPVAAIGLHADLVAGSVTDTELESVQMIREEADRITDLVNQWLFVARPDPGRTKEHNLFALISQTGERLAPVLDHAHAKLKIRSADAKAEKAAVKVDGPRLEQVIRNLIINAAQAMPEGGIINVGIRVEGNRATVSIEDEGPGFSTEALQRFGEPFFSEREGGMGIGLTLAREVVQSHGGILAAENTPEGGAKVICTLPLDHPKN